MIPLASRPLAQLLKDINYEAMNGECHRLPSEANRSFSRIRSLVTHAMNRADDLSAECDTLRAQLDKANGGQS